MSDEPWIAPTASETSSTTTPGEFPASHPNPAKDSTSVTADTRGGPTATTSSSAYDAPATASTDQESPTTTSTTDGTDTQAPRPIPRLTPEEIHEIVEGLVKNRYFVATQCPPNMITSVFMPLLGGLNGMDTTKIGNILEEYAKAGPRSINGYPMFFSCRIIHIDDWRMITEKARAVQQALDEALEKS